MHALVRRAVIAALVVIASPAAAQEAAPPRRAPTTSVGASFGFGGTSTAALPGTISVGTPSSSSPSVVSPTLGLFLELRMSRKAWLLFQGQASYGTSLDGPDVSAGALGIGLGVRNVFNPDALVEVSTFVTASVGYATASRSSTTLGIATSSSSASATSAGLTWGFAFERELVEALYLRLSTGLLGVTWSSATGNTSSTDSLALGLRFSPAIEVRYAF